MQYNIINKLVSLKLPRIHLTKFEIDFNMLMTYNINVILMIVIVMEY